MALQTLVGYGNFIIEASRSNTHATLGKTPPGEWSSPNQRPLPDNTQH